MPYIIGTIIYVLQELWCLKFHTDDSFIMINPLVTYFPSQSGLSSVIHPCCSLDFCQIVLLVLNLAFYSMARTKITPHKSIGPKGVPRHQLAPRSDGASSSSFRPNPYAKVQRLLVELAQATRDRALDAIQVGKLQDQLRCLTTAHKNCERMLVHMVEGRNEA